jgi:hypothetical protein
MCFRGYPDPGYGKILTDPGIKNNTLDTGSEALKPKVYKTESHLLMHI